MTILPDTSGRVPQAYLEQIGEAIRNLRRAARMIKERTAVCDHANVNIKGRDYDEPYCVDCGAKVHPVAFES